MPTRRLARRTLLAAESGFGLFEVLIAALVVAVGLLGGLAALDSALKAGFGAQRHEQAVSLAQREIERLEARAFALLELDAYPSAITDPNPNNPSDPRAFIEGTDLLILASYHDRAGGAPAGSPDREPLIVDPDADPTADGVSIPPLSENVALGPPSATGEQATATVYRFVTRRDESCALLGTGIDLCPAEQGSRRITVAVAPDETGNLAGPAKPAYVASVLTDPDASALDLP